MSGPRTGRNSVKIVSVTRRLNEYAKVHGQWCVRLQGSNGPWLCMSPFELPLNNYQQQRVVQHNPTQDA
jgi:hypothetical protein